MPVQASSPRSHRSTIPLVAAVLATLLAAPGLPGAQSLAEIARREEARRKASKSEAKVFTNRDLGGRSETPPVSSAATPPAAGQPGAQTPAAGQPAPPAQAPAPKPEDPKKDEKYWRQRITDAQDKLARNQLLLEALQTRVNSLSTDFVNRDDPAQRAVISQDRQKALTEMDRMKKDIEGLKKEIAGIQEEARKAGVPPGWSR